MKTQSKGAERIAAQQPQVPSSSPPANPESPDTAKARELLREVCMLASMAIRVSRDRPGLTDELDDDDRDDRIQLLRRTLDRIGWVADVAERKLGGTGAFARAEDWMLPGV